MCADGVHFRVGNNQWRCPVNNFEDAAKSDAEKFGKWHRGMLEQGVYLAPSMYEAGFTSLAHTDEDIEFTINAAKEVFKTL